MGGINKLTHMQFHDDATTIAGNKTMTFINEFVSDEDINKYELNELWDRYHPVSPSKGVRHLSWTVDKEKNIFLIHLKSGREEFANESTFLLWWNGEEIIAHLLRYSGFCRPREGVGQVIWELQDITSPQGIKVVEKDILDTLKLSLKTYGFMGAHREIKNYTVDFKF